MTMRIPLLALAALIAATTARAETLIAPERIIDAAAGDFNRDGRSDMALIASTDPDAMAIGLYIYFRDQRDPDFGLLKLELAAPAALWGDDMREPSIRALGNGSLAVTERNYAIGREHWELTRTLAWRNGKFLVAGYKFDYGDTMQEYPPLNCELNLLTGKGEVNGRAVTFPPASIAVQDWKVEAGEDPGKRICKRK